MSEEIPMVDISDLDAGAFGKAFLQAYVFGGFGALPKREVDLLIFRLLMEHHKEWAEWDDFELAVQLRATKRKIRGLRDELSFRDPTKDEEWRKKELRKILIHAEKQHEKEQVKFQIDDAMLRGYAEQIIRSNLGIVDTSFRSSIITVSGDHYALLAYEVIDDDEQKAVDKELKKWAKDAEAGAASKSIFRIFLEGVAGGAGKKLGSYGISLGLAWLTGGTSIAVESAKALTSLFASKNGGKGP